MEFLFKIADAAAHGLLYFLGALSIFSVSIMIERYFSLRRVLARSNEMGNEFRKFIQNQDFSKFEALTKRTDSLEGRALGYAFSFIKNNGTHGLSEIFDAFKTMERPSLERNLSLLGTIASNAPYVGLLGTVMGIMKAFNDLAVAPGQGNEVVMAGIGHALVSTAIGLAVAIPAVVGFNVLTEKVRTILNCIDTARDLCLAYSKVKKG